MVSNARRMARSSVRTFVAAPDDGNGAGESAAWVANPKMQPPVNTSDHANERQATEKILRFIKLGHNTDTDYGHKTTESR